MELDEFAISQLFNHIPAEEGERDEVWWRETVDGEGYLMVWSDGQHFHTYRHPEDWY
jgi:hypothetical protein